MKFPLLNAFLQGDLDAATRRIKNLPDPVDGRDAVPFDELTPFTTHLANADIHRELDDAATSTTTLWSSQKIQDELDNLVLGVTELGALSDVTLTDPQEDRHVLVRSGSVYVNRFLEEADISDLGPYADLVGGEVPYSQLPISANQVDNWNTAYIWGDHSQEGYAKELSDLADVTVTSPATRHALMYDGSDFVNRALVEADISDLQNYLTDISGFTTDDLSEGAANLYFTEARAISAIQNDASWNASNWDTAFSWGDHSQEGYATHLDELLDVAVSSPVVDHVLVHDGAGNFTNRLLVESDISNLKNYLTDLSGQTTDDLAEGATNLYFQDSRAVSAIQNDASWNATDWDTAFGWGDHSAAGYAADADLTAHTDDLSIHRELDDVATTSTNLWSASKIQNELDNYILTSEKGAAGGVATLDSSSRIPTSQLPGLALAEIFVVADIAARDALTIGTDPGEVQEGDTAIVTDASADPDVDDGGASYVWDGSSWHRLKVPTDAVQSVNGMTGTVVLDTGDVAESGNLYFTDARAVSAIKSDPDWNAADWDTAYTQRGSQIAGSNLSWDGSDLNVVISDGSTTATNLWSAQKIQNELDAVESGAPSVLDDLGDVAISSPADNQVMQYNSGSGDWDNRSYLFVEDTLNLHGFSTKMFSLSDSGITGNGVGYLTVPDTTNFLGYLEVYITSGWNVNKNSGLIQKDFEVRFVNTGTIDYQTSQVNNALGSIVDNWHIGEWEHDATANVFRLPFYQINGSNPLNIQVVVRHRGKLDTKNFLDAIQVVDLVSESHSKTSHNVEINDAELVVEDITNMPTTLSSTWLKFERDDGSGSTVQWSLQHAGSSNLRFNHHTEGTLDRRHIFRKDDVIFGSVGSTSVGINTTPDAAYSLDVSGATRITGNITASNLNISNWDTAYAQRGSQIAGTSLGWDGSNLNVTSITESQISNLQDYALDADVVKLTGNQSISGEKTFNNNVRIVTGNHSDHLFLERTGTNAGEWLMGFWGSGLMIGTGDFGTGTNRWMWFDDTTDNIEVTKSADFTNPVTFNSEVLSDGSDGFRSLKSTGDWFVAQVADDSTSSIFRVRDSGGNDISTLTTQGMDGSGGGTVGFLGSPLGVGTATPKGRLHVTQDIVHGATDNSVLRKYASAHSSTQSGPFKMGELTFDSSSQNIAITGKIYGQSGAASGECNFTIEMRSNTLPDKSIDFWQTQVNAGELITLKVYEDTSSGRVVVGFESSSSLHNWGWEITIIERFEYDFWSNEDEYTLLDTTGLTEISSGSNEMYLMPGGNVGINTTAPNTLFHVAGNATFGDAFTPSATEAENIINILAGDNADGASNGIAFYEMDNGFGMKLGYDGSGSGATNALRFYDDSDTARVTIQNNGFLGINVTAPSSRLHVRDSSITNFNPDNLVTQIIEDASSDGARLELASGEGGNNGSAVILTNVDGTTNHKWSVGASSSANGNYFGVGYAADAANSGIHGIADLVILPNGNVGINTTSPNAPLEINTSGDGSPILRFGIEREWQFEQTGSGSAAQLSLRALTNNKVFKINSSDGTNVASFNAGSGSEITQFYYNGDDVFRIIDGNVRIGVGGNPNSLLDVLGNIEYQTASSTFTDIGNVGATQTFDFASVTNYRGTLNDDATITISNVSNGQPVLLVLYHDGAAQRNISWTGIDRWIGEEVVQGPETVSDTTIITIINDGTNIVAFVAEQDLEFAVNDIIGFNTSSVVDDSILQYDASTSNWENRSDLTLPGELVVENIADMPTTLRSTWLEMARPDGSGNDVAWVVQHAGSSNLRFSHYTEGSVDLRHLFQTEQVIFGNIGSARIGINKSPDAGWDLDVDGSTRVGGNLDVLNSLDVSGTVDIDGQTHIHSSSTSTPGLIIQGSRANLKLITDNATGGAAFRIMEADIVGDGGTTTVGQVGILGSSGDGTSAPTSSFMYLTASPNGAYNNEATLKVDSNDRVGIALSGSTRPDYTLEVGGDVWLQKSSSYANAITDDGVLTATRNLSTTPSDQQSVTTAVFAGDTSMAGMGYLRIENAYDGTHAERWSAIQAGANYGTWGAGPGPLDGDSAYLNLNPHGGNVGVGKTLPTVLLDVAGEGRFGGALTLDSDAVGQPSTATTALNFPFLGTEGIRRNYITLQGVNANDATNEDTGAFIKFRTSTGEDWGPQIGGVRRSGGAGDFIVMTGSAVPVDRFIVRDNGDVDMLASASISSDLEVGNYLEVGVDVVTTETTIARIYSGNNSTIYFDISYEEDLRSSTNKDALTFNGTGSSGAATLSNVAFGTNTADGYVTAGVLGLAVGDVDMPGAGSAEIANDFDVGGTKNFKIPHPVPSKKKTHKLRHGVYEGPVPGGTIYRYTIDVRGVTEFELPDYFKYLNKDAQVWCQPDRHFGRAYGVIEGNTLTITAEHDGRYQVLILATRNDEAVQNWKLEEVSA